MYKFIDEKAQHDFIKAMIEGDIDYPIFKGDIGYLYGVADQMGKYGDKLRLLAETLGKITRQLEHSATDENGNLVEFQL